MNWIKVREAKLHAPKEGMQAIVLTKQDVDMNLPGMHCTYINTPSFTGFEPVHCEKCEGIPFNRVACYLPIPERK